MVTPPRWIRTNYVWNEIILGFSHTSLPDQALLVVVIHRQALGPF